MCHNEVLWNVDTNLMQNKCQADVQENLEKSNGWESWNRHVYHQLKVVAISKPTPQ